MSMPTYMPCYAPPLPANTTSSNGRSIPSEQELDALLGTPAKLESLWGILIKHVANNNYGVWDGMNLYPDSINLTGIKYSEITEFAQDKWNGSYKKALNCLENPCSMKHLQIATNWHFRPITTNSLKPIEFKITVNKNKSSAKESLGSEMNFFFPKDPNVNEDGTLKIKGPREFL